MGIAAGYHGDIQFFPQGVGEPLGALPVQSQILAVQVQKLQTAKLLLGKLGHVAGGAEGMAAAHQHRVLAEQLHQLGEGQEPPLLLVGFQPAVQLQDGLQGADGQDVAPFGHIGFHAGENFQAVLQFQSVPGSPAHRGDVAVHVGKLEGVEMLRQA